jgi:hypothetical protein
MTYVLFVVGMIVFLGLCRALVVWLIGPTAQVSTGPKARLPAGTPTSRPE